MLSLAILVRLNKGSDIFSSYDIWLEPALKAHTFERVGWNIQGRCLLYHIIIYETCIWTLFIFLCNKVYLRQVGDNKQKWPPRNNWNIVESGVKHHEPKSYFCVNWTMFIFLAANVGGQMGLFLGASILTVTELCEFLFFLSWYAFVLVSKRQALVYHGSARR
jgi:hypothetical protein